MTQNHLLTADEVSEILGVTPSTLARWRQARNPELPYLSLNGRIRYRPEDVDAFVDDADEDGDDEEDEDEDEDEDDGG